MNPESKIPALKTNKINKFLGEGSNRTHILNNISIELNPSQVYSIVGPSGCGKSSLLYVLGLLDQPDSGEIWINDLSINHSDDSTRTKIRNEHMGFVFQFHFLLTEFSALDNILLPMKKLNSLSPQQMKENAYTLLKNVGLEKKAHRLGSQLSGGEQQRVAIARALANNPSLIFADEPTGNLDAKNSDMIFELLKQLAYEGNQAILIVTHNKEIAQQCDQTLHMEDGSFCLKG